MKYRAEIDGLRALAVLPVILFHAGFEAFGGGFVGVDVFFVISGYLITTILVDDIENKRFSILKFYERRARRILPALFFIMMVCIPFAWMWMLPSQLKDFSQSLIAVSLFASNILFWRSSGYFAPAAEEKPLLHTWSLAVEEQYYLLFPIFLFIAWRFGKNKVIWMLVFMAVASLLISEWGWRNKASANFYLAPSRAWELFAGSIAAFIVQARGVQKNEVMSMLGLTAITFAIFAYDKSTPFPSVYTLVPVIGVVLLIIFADMDTFAARILSTKIFVGIGLVSYSAYLWHQPLFAFARIKSLEAPSELLMASLSVLSLLLAVASYKFIEVPFRKKRSLSRNRIFIFSTLGTAFFLSLGSVISTSENARIRDFQRPMWSLAFGNDHIDLLAMVERAEEELSTSNYSHCLLAAGDTRLFDLKNIKCKYNRVVVLFGDSHSRDIYDSLGKANQLIRPGLLILSAHKGGCRITENKSNLCKQHYDNFKKFLSQRKLRIDVIVYVQAARGLINGTHINEVEVDQLKRSLAELEPYASNLIWLGPRGGIGLTRKQISYLCSKSASGSRKENQLRKFEEAMARGRIVDNALSMRMLAQRELKYVSQLDILNLNSGATNNLTDCTEIYWSNEDHLSRFGEEKFSSEYIEWFNNLLID